VREQTSRQTGVLGHDEVRAAQGLAGAWGEVAQVADRRANHQEPTRHAG
jgi:hypothetical protein